jgi:hypothetical protein
MSHYEDCPKLTESEQQTDQKISDIIRRIEVLEIHAKHYSGIDFVKRVNITLSEHNKRIIDEYHSLELEVKARISDVEKLKGKIERLERIVEKDI